MLGVPGDASWETVVRLDPSYAPYQVSLVEFDVYGGYYEIVRVKQHKSSLRCI